MEELQDTKASRASGYGVWGWLAVVPCVFLALWVWNSQWAAPWLTVRNPAGLLMFSVPLPAGQEFGIRFRHSVALSPVEEWFTAEEGLLALKRAVYQDFGAGLPHMAEAGQSMTFVDGRIVLTGFTLKLAQMEVRVGRVAGHELLLAVAEESEEGDLVKTKPLAPTFPLVAWGAPGTALRFAVEVPSLWVRLRSFFRQ